MKQAIKNFNDLLKRNNSVAIVCIEDRTEWTIEAKNNEDDFIKAIEAVVKNMYDECECAVMNAEQFDSGYSMEVYLVLHWPDTAKKDVTILLYHANAF